VASTGRPAPPRRSCRAWVRSRPTPGS
jgi:hypothetical protein